MLYSFKNPSAINCLEHTILLFKKSKDLKEVITVTALFLINITWTFHILHSNRLALSLHCKQWLEMSQYTLQCQTYLIFLVLHSRLASWALGNTSDVYCIKSCDIDTGVTAESLLLHFTRLWWGCHHIKGKGRTCSVFVNANWARPGRSLLFADCTTL